MCIQSYDLGYVFVLHTALPSFEYVLALLEKYTTSKL